MPPTHRDHSHIQAWGVDLERSNRPAVPMERTPPRLEGVHWDEPEQQPQHVEVLVSRERQGMPPVFGTSVPPNGPSAGLRRKAFEYTENNIKHWLLLIAADRVDVMEGRAEDFKQLPRHHPVAAAALIGGVALLGMWMQRRRDSARHREMQLERRHWVDERDLDPAA